MTDPLGEIAQYYSRKLAEHGPTPHGVDWNGEDSQTVRFAQLANILDLAGGFSVTDLGCGYGALLAYLSDRFEAIRYRGLDIAPEMIEAARARFADYPRAHFEVGAVPTQISDFGFASGIFNVRLERSDSDWLEYVEHTLDALDRTSGRGFAFNCLTSYSDADKMRDYLFYANPGTLFDLCKRKYSRQVALLHDYGLYEFTILVRKT